MLVTLRVLYLTNKLVIKTLHTVKLHVCVCQIDRERLAFGLRLEHRPSFERGGTEEVYGGGRRGPHESQ